MHHHVTVRHLAESRDGLCLPPRTPPSHQNEAGATHAGHSGLSPLVRRTLALLFLAAGMALYCWGLYRFIAALDLRPGIGDVQAAHRKVKAGMTKDEVRAMLGRPSEEWDDEWRYSESMFISSSLRIDFGPDDRVKASEWWAH